MSRHTLVTVTYHNHETGQEMVVNFYKAKKKNHVDLDVVFDPEITDATKDPGGIMQKVFQTLAGQDA